MKRLSLAFLVVLGLMLALTPMLSAYAEVQLPAYIKFKGHAVGTCFLVRGTGSYAMLNPEWYGNVSGNIVLGGYAKATSYVYYEEKPQSWSYGWAYSTDPEGYVRAVGSLSVRWLEDNEPHRLLITIYSRPTSQGVFQPENATFIAGLPPTGAPYPPNWEEPLLGLRGIYKAGSNVQHISGSIVIGGLGAEGWGGGGIIIGLWFGDSHMMIFWVSEPTEGTASWDPNLIITLPAATILVTEAELL